MTASTLLWYLSLSGCVDAGYLARVSLAISGYSFSLRARASLDYCVGAEIRAEEERIPVFT